MVHIMIVQGAYHLAMISYPPVPYGIPPGDRVRERLIQHISNELHQLSCEEEGSWSGEEGVLTRWNITKRGGSCTSGRTTCNNVKLIRGTPVIRALLIIVLLVPTCSLLRVCSSPVSSCRKGL